MLLIFCGIVIGLFFVIFIYGLWVMGYWLLVMGIDIVLVIFGLY